LDGLGWILSSDILPIFSIAYNLFSDLIPQQMKDSKESGVFLCQYAKCYSRNDDILFKLAHMKTFRHQMKQELKYKTLFFWSYSYLCIYEIYEKYNINLIGSG
jgi:hypothetical protein